MPSREWTALGKKKPGVCPLPPKGNESGLWLGAEEGLWVGVVNGRGLPPRSSLTRAAYPPFWFLYYCQHGPSSQRQGKCGAALQCPTGSTLNVPAGDTLNNGQDHYVAGLLTQDALLRPLTRSPNSDQLAQPRLRIGPLPLGHSSPSPATRRSSLCFRGSHGPTRSPHTGHGPLQGERNTCSPSPWEAQLRFFEINSPAERGGYPGTSPSWF